MVAIDWVQRIVGIIGSLGNLVRASLQQNRGRIHHSGDCVGAVCEVGWRFRGSVAGLFGLSGLSSLFRSRTRQPKKPNNQTDKRNQMNQILATRCEMLVCKT